MRRSDQPFASSSRHISKPVIAFKQLRPGSVWSNPVPAPAPAGLRAHRRSLRGCCAGALQPFRPANSIREGQEPLPKSRPQGLHGSQRRNSARPQFSHKNGDAIPLSDPRGRVLAGGLIAVAPVGSCTSRHRGGRHVDFGRAAGAAGSFRCAPHRRAALRSASAQRTPLDRTLVVVQDVVHGVLDAFRNTFSRPFRGSRNAPPPGRTRSGSNG